MRRFCRVKNVVIGQGVNADRRRLCINSDLTSAGRGVATGIGDADLNIRRTVREVRQYVCRYVVMPATVALDGCSQGCATNADNHCLARFHVLRQTFQCDPRPFFGGIDHVIARCRVDGDGDRVEIDGHAMTAGCLVEAVIGGDGDGQAVLPFNQRFQLIAADTRLPAPTRANLRGKLLTIDLQLYGRARLNMAAGPADGQ